MVPSTLWHGTAIIVYNSRGGRDVLVLAPDLSHPHPEAVARRPGQLTEEDNLKLQRQGLATDCQSELDIIRARHELDKRHKIVKVKSGQSMSQNDAIESIVHLFNTTQNDGGKDIGLPLDCALCSLAECREYRRSGFDCEILMIANFEIFLELAIKGIAK